MVVNVNDSPRDCQCPVLQPQPLYYGATRARLPVKLNATAGTAVVIVCMEDRSTVAEIQEIRSPVITRTT